jgi:ankyrin repeat protein
MNKDILNIILNDVLYNDINSIKKTSLISKNMCDNIQLLTMKDRYKNALDILQKYRHPNSCIEKAAKNGHINIVQLMIEKDVHRSIDWNNAMNSAALGGHIDIVQLIIEKGALRTTQCSAQRSIDWNWAKGMEYAAYGGHMNIVQFMIEKDVQGSIDWNDGMDCAAEGGHIDIVQLMIEKGATDWDCAMAMAAFKGHMNIVQLMIDKGANDWNWALHKALNGGRMNIVQFMIEKLAQRSIDLDDAMSYATRYGHADVIELLKQYQQ